MSQRSKSVGGRSGRDELRRASSSYGGDKASMLSEKRREITHSKRSAQVRRRIHELATELEEVERSMPPTQPPPTHTTTPSDAGITSSLSGFQIALNESANEAAQYKKMLGEALQESKHHRGARASLQEEVDNLNEQLAAHREEVRRNYRVSKDAGGEHPPEIEVVHLRAELAHEKREKEAFKMKYDALLMQQQRDVSPVRTQHVTPRARDGMKRIELEARCATLEQMVKSHEKTRSHLILPNTIRSILAEHSSIDAAVQDAVMGDVHDHISEREGRPRSFLGASPGRSSLRGGGASPYSHDSHHPSSRGAHTPTPTTPSDYRVDRSTMSR